MHDWRVAIPSVVLSAVHIFCLPADILIRQLLGDHVGLNTRLLLVPNVKESLVQLLFGRAKWETVVFVSRTACKKENLEHRKCQVVVVLTSSRQLTRVLTKIRSKKLEVLASILRWMTAFNRCLEIFKTLD